ncbi:Flavohemoprotein lateral transfer candidate [Giardia lamblia P15]|uniref:Flavohemoprotein-2 n=1 Tax=Giardia intestinalis (strain P15) TaxID=658858 RepID=HMP2_GIAIA|nr:RecName: Full=Flavohemoprotein-2; AltName: Full=Flavohemoglobin-2; Short=FlavoHb-2; AltName: Full=Hemoglobin-like protein-2; AltName: Full=Nitric oxide dioxygenase-2; Short=NO oxygenase-2; Short=NOD-2 [Giardia lamblia P15]EFO61241.1 Flavohemoprotein lateral transfer candidate [Giardia lamblia P15]
MALSEDTIKAVEATAGLIAAQGIEFTRAFYERMLTKNEELKDIFNLAHQRTLRQPKALLDSLVAYALSIRRINELYELKGKDLPWTGHLAELQGFFSVAERVANKHTSVGIQPAQYQIVGAHLLATIEDRVTKDKAVLAAWGKAYEFLADLLIKREEEIYAETEGPEGGWRQTRTFRVEEKTRVNEVICRFRLVPAKGGASVVQHKPGQYLAIFVRNPELFQHQQIRQYSIMSAPNSAYYEIAVHKDGAGTVSRYLHDHVDTGDLLEVAPPYGDFFLRYLEAGEQTAADTQASSEFQMLQGRAVNFAAEKTAPIVLISGGIGQTPLLSMLRFLAQKEGRETARPIFWIHAAHDSRVRAFKEEVDAIREAALPSLRVVTFLSEVRATDREGEDYDFAGRINLDRIPELARLEAGHANPHYFFVGPTGFMTAVEEQLRARSVPDDRIHFEMFGPFKASH